MLVTNPSHAAEIATKEIGNTALSITDRFEKVMPPRAPFNKPEYMEFSKAMLSNLIGGIGYFHGSGLIDPSAAPEYDEENEGFWEETAQARSRVQPEEEEPHELFTCIPSRPFFPRGFLWDEGFHLIPVIDWDTDLTYGFPRKAILTLTNFTAGSILSKAGST
jgi:mannosyl-oligosaccharide glucosidase